MIRRMIRIRNLNITPRYGFFKPPSFDTTKDYYKILNSTSKDDIQTIKKNYYDLAKKYHPDMNKGNEEKFKQISEAYEV